MRLVIKLCSVSPYREEYFGSSLSAFRSAITSRQCEESSGTNSSRVSCFSRSSSDSRLHGALLIRRLQSPPSVTPAAVSDTKGYQGRPPMARRGARGSRRMNAGGSSSNAQGSRAALDSRREVLRLCEEEMNHMRRILIALTLDLPVREGSRAPAVCRSAPKRVPCPRYACAPRTSRRERRRWYVLRRRGFDAPFRARPVG